MGGCWWNWKLENKKDNMPESNTKRMVTQSRANNLAEFSGNTLLLPAQFTVSSIQHLSLVVLLIYATYMCSNLECHMFCGLFVVSTGLAGWLFCHVAPSPQNLFPIFFSCGTICASCQFDCHANGRPAEPMNQWRRWQECRSRVPGGAVCLESSYEAPHKTGHFNIPPCGWDTILLPK